MAKIDNKLHSGNQAISNDILDEQELENSGGNE